MINHRPAPAVSGCIDVALGFTPATNLLSIRRLALAVGARAEVTVAWFASPAAPTSPAAPGLPPDCGGSVFYRCPDLPF